MSEWVDKYKPTKWEEVLSKETNRTIIQNFFWAWENGAPFSNALLLAGEEGCGKTTVVEVAAKEHDMTLISINASDCIVATSAVGVGTTSLRSAVDLGNAGSLASRFMIPPRVASSDRGSLTNLVAGAMIYNTTDNRLEYYNGSAWRQITDAAI